MYTHIHFRTPTTRSSPTTIPVVMDTYSMVWLASGRKKKFTSVMVENLVVAPGKRSSGICDAISSLARSLQLLHIPVTAFSQTDLFLV